MLCHMMASDAVQNDFIATCYDHISGLRSPGGLLLYGPSGGGKTMLVNALAKEFSVHFISVSGAEIWSR